MISKLLVANRGEIALRIVRACRELGIKTIAVYSEADEQSLHVQLADEAICIGPAPSNESYLRSERIISAAEVSNVDAIHPGYGFLAESAEFAEQCKGCNIIFVGPRPETIRDMGDKARAREIAKKAKVPIIPGSEGVISSEKEALKVAQKIGFPVIIKAVAGGGGKGMRLAYNAVSFSREYETARHEAEKAFGNGDVYIEKFIEEPRHIEFQVLADQHGKAIHCFERDCSVQRRYQKLIEEGPSPYLSADLRKKMGQSALRIVEACNYQNAGTIEFLVDKKGDYYFIEMNTRIQVEHGVTEEMTDIDLVKAQLLIASGERLWLEQKDVKILRHAIECRINAENPSRNFMPCPGEVQLYYPPGGHGVRVDSHCYAGYHIPHYYDSMIGKLITHGPNRKIAIDRMRSALSEYLIRGFDTTASFCQAVMKDPTFQAGGVTTRYIDDFLARAPKTMFQ
jgi:acetyl-CoA carboxylase biotin carboxylase subunit